MMLIFSCVCVSSWQAAPKEEEEEEEEEEGEEGSEEVHIVHLFYWSFKLSIMIFLHVQM